MNLPIATYRNDIIKAVLRNPYTIIAAEPASGKSTLVPQYLSEIYDKVIITNPRVMPCITLATYVAEQMGEELGGYIGYRTGFKRCSSPDTVIEYVTDAFQLVRSIYNESKDKRIAIVIDEVHEWTQATESLVAWCKFMSKAWNAKIIIMSATMETDKLARYLGVKDTAVLKIPGKIYDVKVEQRGEDELISTIMEKIAYRRNTLVFLPTQKKIYQVMEELQEEGTNAVILPLYSELGWEGQKKCYETYLKPVVILSTNIAQTSVTIPGINSVVDTGTAIVPTAKDGIVEYALTDISQADITQRMHRAGRMDNGDYTLCSDTPINEREKYPVPEIQRSLLDQTALRLATIGVDIETLEFFHQPKQENIEAAKQKLRNAGALDENGNVTEIGYKIAKMPISTEKARMILEAEKHGVVKEVITIAAITEVGGLLQRGAKQVGTRGKYNTPVCDTEARYSDFTTETTSDLLAELDVWNYLMRLNYIDFKALGINRRNFNHARDHIDKITYALQDTVEISSNDDREAILLACLSVQTFNIHTYNCSWNFLGEDDVVRSIDRRSCLHRGYIDGGSFLFGKPIRIPYKDRLGYENCLDILQFATKVDSSLLIKLIPDRIENREEILYNCEEDAVIVSQFGYFRGNQISYDSHVDYNHPEHARLKAEYEELEAERERRRAELERRQAEYDWTYSRLQSRNTQVDTEQRTVVIDGKVFDVSHFYPDKPTVNLDGMTLLTTKQNEVFLDNGKQVYFESCYILSRRCKTISELRKAVEMKLRARVVQEVKDTHESQKVPTIRELLLKQGRLGEAPLYQYFGTYQHNFGSVYVCLYLDRNTVTFKVVEDEETANSNTLTAIQHLFMKEINSLYGESKFSHLLGSKKKILTPREVKHKEDFDSFVKECMPDLSVENISERLELLAEFYQELMEADY